MSFNRPAYLRLVLESLVRQVGARLDARPIVLFQDGHLNRWSGVERADPADVAASVALFRELVPQGRVELSPENLGVALNFERAELTAFEELDADAAIFLEDDLVLDPRYIATVDAMLDLARGDSRIGYVAAYGEHLMPLAAQLSHPVRYTMLGHNWGFGLTRRQWRRNRVYVDQYLRLLRGVDYKLRPRKAIHRLYHSWAMGCPGDSQDTAKSIACVLTDGAKINTTAVLGQYIGAEGLHMTPKMFASRRYAETQMFTGAMPAFPPLADADYARIMEQQRGWATARPCDVS